MGTTGVRHEIFFREDIENLLRSIDMANSGLAVHLPSPQMGIYRAGFVAALQAVAAAFDLRLDIRAPQLDVLVSTATRPGENE